MNKEARAGTIVVAGTTAIQTLATMCANTVPAIAPIMATALGVSPSLVGLQVSLLYCLAAATTLLSGACVRRLGAMLTSQLALLGIAAGLSLCAVPSLAAIAVGSMLMGAAYGLPTPAASHLLARFTVPERRNFIFSLKQTGVPAGIALAGLAAPSLALASDWRAPLLAGAAAAAALAVVFTPIRAVLDDDRAASGPLLALPSLSAAFAVAALRPLFMVGVLMAAVQVGMSSFLVTILVEDYAFAPVGAGLVLAAMQGAGIVGRLAGGALADRIGGATTLTALAATSSATTMALVHVSAAQWPLVVGLLILFGLTAVSWTGILMAETVRLAPPGRVSDTTSALLFGTFLGILVGPSLFGATGALMGYRRAFGLLAAASVAAAIFSLLVRRRAR